LALALAVIAQPWSAAEATNCNGGYAPRITISGDVTSERVYTLADLQAMASSLANVAYYSGRSGMQSYSFIGVPLLDLLQASGIVTDPVQKNDILRKYLVISASDCYQAVIAVADLLPTFGGQQVIVAYADGTGTPLPADEGMARLVVPGDKSGGRYVSNVVRIVVRSPGPGPQTK
jgi:Sulfite oxidase and related enzymes